VSKHLSGVSHCLVRTAATEADMQGMDGTIATVALCFGDDKNVFCPIKIKRVPGPTVHFSAELPKSVTLNKGEKTIYHVLMGPIGEEAKMMALVAFDKVKQASGLKFGKKFRVFDKKVEEV